MLVCIIDTSPDRGDGGNGDGGNFNGYGGRGGGGDDDGGGGGVGRGGGIEFELLPPPREVQLVSLHT